MKNRFLILVMVSMLAVQVDAVPEQVEIHRELSLSKKEVIGIPIFIALCAFVCKGGSQDERLKAAALCGVLPFISLMYAYIRDCNTATTLKGVVAKNVHLDVAGRVALTDAQIEEYLFVDRGTAYLAGVHAKDLTLGPHTVINIVDTCTFNPSE